MMPAWLTVRLAAYLAGALAIVTGLWLAYSWAHGRGVADERARWEAATAEAGARFAEALAAQQLVIADLDRDLTAARRRADRRREGLSDAFQKDPAAGDWAGVPVPDSVRAALSAGRAVPGDPGDAD